MLTDDEVRTFNGWVMCIRHAGPPPHKWAAVESFADKVAAYVAADEWVMRSPGDTVAICRAQLIVSARPTLIRQGSD